MVCLQAIPTHVPTRVIDSVSSSRRKDGRNHGHRPRTARSMELSGAEWEWVEIHTTVCRACEARETERGAEFCPECQATAARAVAGDCGAFAELIAMRG